MKVPQEIICAYIDGANLHRGVGILGWELDYSKFRVWLREKFKVETPYIFLGNIPKYSKLYAYLQECGYILIFKEVVYDPNGKAKGNCDADLVLKMIQDYYEKRCHKSLLVSSDGDYSALVSFLLSRSQMKGVLSPANEKKCSILLKRTGVKLYYINDQKNKLKK